MYAIIKTGGKQYKVAEGDVLNVEKLSYDVNNTVEILEVLLVSQDGKIKVGSPYVNGAKVVAEVVEQGKCKKVISFKYKRKTGFHKKIGHRQQFTALKIVKIEA